MNSSYVKIGIRVWEFLPCNGGEEKWSNDTPTSNGRSSECSKIEEIHKAHPRYTSSNKNGEEQTKSDVVQALKANNLSNNKPRIPYHRAIEHDGKPQFPFTLWMNQSPKQNPKLLHCKFAIAPSSSKEKKESTFDDPLGLKLLPTQITFHGMCTHHITKWKGLKNWEEFEIESRIVRFGWRRGEIWRVVWFLRVV